MIKKLTASPKMTVRAMYREPVDIERRGRVVLTTNTDADSLSILPNLDGTILDKLMIVKILEPLHCRHSVHFVWHEVLN